MLSVMVVSAGMSGITGSAVLVQVYFPATLSGA
jgi:hypothetical protein